MVLLQVLLAAPILLPGYLIEPRRLKSDYACSLLWAGGVVSTTAVVNLGISVLFSGPLEVRDLAMAAYLNWMIGIVIGAIVLTLALVLLGIRRVKRMMFGH